MNKTIKQKLNYMTVSANGFDVKLDTVEDGVFINTINGFVEYMKKKTGFTNLCYDDFGYDCYILYNPDDIRHKNKRNMYISVQQFMSGGRCQPYSIDSEFYGDAFFVNEKFNTITEREFKMFTDMLERTYNENFESMITDEKFWLEYEGYDNKVLFWFKYVFQFIFGLFVFRIFERKK
jgi:hypothetical protein